MIAGVSSDSSSGRTPVASRLVGVAVAVLLVGGAGLIGSGALALYGMGWSERHLSRVRLGMTGAEVRAVAGEPGVVARVNGGEHWCYTRWWSADADVYFDPAGRVRAVVTD